MSNLAVAGSDKADETEELPAREGFTPLAAAVGEVFGALKKEVMLAFCFGFLGSEPAAGPRAFRLTEDMADRVGCMKERGIW